MRRVPDVSGRGASQLLRRVLAGACLCAALLGAGVVAAWKAVLLAGLGLALYAFWPPVRVRPGALVLRRGPAILGPDLIGFGLLAFFVALPVWVGRSEGVAGLHGSALLIWAMLPAPLVILWAGAASACFAVSVGDDGLTVAGMGRTRSPAWDEIAGWRRWRRGLPRFLRFLAPFLSPTAAGAVLLARDSTGVELCLADGSRLRLPHEGFERGEARVIEALREHGVPRLRGSPAA